MKQLLICLLFAYAVALRAQNTPQAVIERMNQSLLAIEKGEYWANYKFKSLINTDTSAGAGLVRYFKTNGGPGDTLARFITWPTGNWGTQGSDGEVYFYLRKDSVIAIDQVRQKKGLINYLSKGNGFRIRVLSLPILTNRGHVPVDPEKWSTAQVGQFTLNDTVFVELYRRRLFPIKMKLTPTAKDSMIYTDQWLLFPDTYTPRRITAWADQQDGHVQYEEINYTAIRPLPPEAAFEKEYNVAEMVKNGYRVSEIDHSALPKTRETQVGDSIPNFMVRLETGDTMPIFSAFQQRYVVLDFWYRSCGPCNLAMPGLDRTARALNGKDIAIVGVNPIDQQYNALIEQYKHKYGYSFPIVFTERAVADQMKIKGYPQLLVVDQQTRRVIHVQPGYSEEGEKGLRVFLENLLR